MPRPFQPIGSVTIVDDQALSRAGLRALLEHELGFRVVAEGAGPESVALESQPSVVIVGSGDALAALAMIRTLGSATPPTACVRLDARASAEAIKAAFDAGALAYLLRDDAATDLGSAVRAAAAGQRFVSPLASTALVDHVQQREPALPHHALTRRQLEVLRLVAQGRSTKTIARDLGLSTKTVDAHRYQIGRRLQVHDVAGLVRYALRHSLVGNER